MIAKLTIYFLVLIIFFFVISAFLMSNNELFVTGYGRFFSSVYHPQRPCCVENGCVRGHTARFTQYNNMCEPKTYSRETGEELRQGDGILKQKIDLRDTCLRSL